MDIKNTLIALIAVAALALGLGTAVTHPQSAPTTQKVGALTGPVLPFNYLTVGGVTTFDTGAIKTGTSTICYSGPYSATTTVQNAQLSLTTGSTSAIAIQAGYGPVLGTIATQVGTNYNIAAGAQATIVASSSLSGTQVSPNNYFMFKVVNGGANDAEAGSCQIEQMSF